MLTEDCLNSCMPEGKFSLFEVRPGTSIKDLPDFPLELLLASSDARFRFVTICTYLAVLTDYLKHEDEYDFREKAPTMPRRVPKGYRFEDLPRQRGLGTGRNHDPK